MNISKSSALERLEEFVKKTPDRDAVIFEPDERLTFSELWLLSGKIYAWLKQKAIGAEDVVMYCLPRGLMLYACMVGTMRVGAAFVLAETQNSPERTAYIRTDSQCRLFVDESCLPEILSCSPLEGYEPIRLHNLCYIAYTSGTTGHPKGVMHEYGSLDNAWKAVMVDGKAIMSETDTFLSMSPMNFVAMPIIFAYSCGHGCAVAVMPYKYTANKDTFSDYLERAGITCGYVTPSFLRKLLPFQYPWHMCILSAEPADGLFIPGMRCYNTYASTEGGCLLSVYELPEAMSPAPVGRSYSDVEVLITDENGKEVPYGETGEICFRNPYVRGYIHQSKAPSGEHADENPSSADAAKPGLNKHDGLFHTGDAGKIGADGSMVVLGRVDEMFKIRGYRIEPDEVAGAVTRVSGLSHVVIRGFVFRNISSIIAFYADDVTVDPVSLHELLRKEIPEYMIPTNYIQLKAFPLLGSGKVDKLRLLPPEGNWEGFQKNASAHLPLVDTGRSACVYDMGNGILLKQFRESVPYRTAWEELTRTRTAHACGLPVPEVYDVIRSDDGYGLLMKQLPGVNLEALLRRHPQDRLLLIDRFAGAVKALHRTVISDDGFPDAVEVSLALCEQISDRFCSDSERKQIRTIFQRLPRTETFIHGDCHPGNAMWNDGIIQFLDLPFAGKGHPVFDLLGVYSHYVFLPSFETEEAYFSAAGMTKKDAAALYERFLETSYAEADSRALSQIREWIRGVHAAKILLASVLMPGVFSDAVFAEAKRRAILFSKEYCGDMAAQCPLPISYHE